MYGHYFLMSVGSTLSRPLRKYLTSLQLLQFLVILAQNAYAAWRGEGCGMATWNNVLMVVYMLAMLVLFANFFVKSYSTKPGLESASPREQRPASQKRD